MGVVVSFLVKMDILVITAVTSVGVRMELIVRLLTVFVTAQLVGRETCVIQCVLITRLVMVVRFRVTVEMEVFVILIQESAGVLV